jgi:Flp pilus assembly protein TadG
MDPLIALVIITRASAFVVRRSSGASIKGLFEGRGTVQSHFREPFSEMRGQAVIAQQLPQMSLRRHMRHLDRGVAAVEMVFVLPVLLAILIGIIDFSRIYNGEIQLSQAAREGARIAAMGDLAGFRVSDATTRAGAALSNPAFEGNAPSFSVDVVKSDGSPFALNAVCTDSTNLARVTITIPYTKIMWGPDTLTQTAVMRCAG